MNQRLFSPKEIAQALGVSQASIKRWVDKGIIKAEKTIFSLIELEMKPTSSAAPTKIKA